MAVSVTASDSSEMDTAGDSNATISGWSPNASSKSAIIVHTVDGSPSSTFSDLEIGGTAIPLVAMTTQNTGSGEGRTMSVWYTEDMTLSGDIVSQQGSSVGQFIGVIETDGYLAAHNLTWMNEANPMNTLAHVNNSTEWLAVFGFSINLASTAVTASGVTVQQETTDAVMTGTFYAALASRQSTGAVDNCDYFNCSSNQQHAYFAALFSDTKRDLSGAAVSAGGGFEILDTLNNDAAFNAIFSRPS